MANKWNVEISAKISVAKKRNIFLILKEEIKIYFCFRSLIFLVFNLLQGKQQHKWWGENRLASMTYRESQKMDRMAIFKRK